MTLKTLSRPQGTMSLLDANITLTRYEVAKLVGLRALQLEQDASPLIDVKPNEPFINIATRELHLGKLDAKVVRGEKAHHLSVVNLPQELHALVDIQNGKSHEKSFMTGHR